MRSIFQSPCVCVCVYVQWCATRHPYTAWNNKFQMIQICLLFVAVAVYFQIYKHIYIPTLAAATRIAEYIRRHICQPSYILAQSGKNNNNDISCCEIGSKEAFCCGSTHSDDLFVSFLHASFIYCCIYGILGSRG